MGQFTETIQPSSEHVWPHALNAKRLIAAFAILTGAWVVPGCSGGNDAASAAGGPTARPSSSALNTYPPLTAPPGGSARADVFLRGIAALPDDLELETIIDRICKLREEDSTLPRRTSPPPNTLEIGSLERGYDQLYSAMNGLPGPGAGGEQWAQREERRQCP